PDAYNIGMTGLGYVGLGIGKGLYQGARQAGKYFKPTSVSSSVDDVKKTSIGEDLKSLFSNINPKNLKTESAVDWMKRWYSHPNFIRRYSPTGKYDKDAMQEHILEELVAYQPKNYLDLLNDKGLIKYLKQSLRSDGVSWGVPDQIYVNRTSFAPFNKKRLESVRAHELSHLIDYNGNWLSEADIEALLKPFNLESIQQNRGFLKRLLGDNAQYYLDPSEIHARMNQARFNLGLSPSDVFTEEMFNYISKKEDWYGMGKYIKDKKSFIDLMNKFWVVLPAALVTGALQQQEGKPKYIKGNFKQGGWLDKYEQGGLILKKKTKDNFGKKANPNDVDATVGPNFEGWAYNTKGRNYSPAWGGQFQMGGKLTFLEPTSKKLPAGYNPITGGSSTEYAVSIGGEDGEPAYLIPSFKYGELLYNPKAEFKRTGE
ncbi:MAG: hypothetical protein EBU90_30500, partial [Proteobacteria bacterium]|nr:hypothetical protein [Pseudomonadota bacterium]